MADLTLSPMRVQGASATLAKAAEKLGVPVPPSEAKTMTVLWWEYGDGSGCGPVRVYTEASRAEQDMALLRDEHSGKLYRLEPVPLL